MRPFLFPDTLFETSTYYVLYLLAFLGAILLATRRAEKFGLNPVRAIDLGIVAFVCGVFGARLFHILFEAPDYYLSHPVRVFYLWQGGFVLYGGLIVGVLGCYVFMKKLHEPIGKWADVAAPAILLGIGIGRGGCLSAGCCFGKPTHSFLGMIFTDPRSAAPLNTPLVPTQAIEMLFALLITAAFLYVFRKPCKQEGASLLWAAMVYSLFRFIIEFFRGDLDRGIYFHGMLSTSQFVSIVIFLGCGIWLGVGYLRSRLIL